MIKKEFHALALIVLAFVSGMVLTAATSGCDTHVSDSAHAAVDASRGPSVGESNL